MLLLLCDDRPPQLEEDDPTDDGDNALSPPARDEFVGLTLGLNELVACRALINAFWTSVLTSSSVMIFRSMLFVGESPPTFLLLLLSTKKSPAVVVADVVAAVAAAVASVIVVASIAAAAGVVFPIVLVDISAVSRCLDVLLNVGID